MKLMSGKDNERESTELMQSMPERTFTHFPFLVDSGNSCPLLGRVSSLCCEHHKLILILTLCSSCVCSGMNTDAVKFAHVINETSSITDADGHRMHIMEGDVAVPDDPDDHPHRDETVNEINKFPEVRGHTHVTRCATKR